MRKISKAAEPGNSRQRVEPSPKTGSANENRRVGDLSYSGTLATQLAKHFGLESAKRACIENRWDAVLSALQGRRPDQGGA